MSVILGQLSAPTESGVVNPRVTRDVNEFTDDLWFPYASMQDMRVPGVFSTHYPVEANGRVIGGSRSLNYTDDLYYRVHIIPTTINFGNVVSTQARDVELWNATFEMQPLTTLSLGGALGLTTLFDPELVLPKVLPPLWSLNFQVVASPLGPPTIDETLTVEIGGVTLQVPVLGRRIIVFPFPPNWRGGVEDSYVYKSWVLRGSDGSVQTGSQWGNKPRRETAYSILLTRDHSARFENMMMGWQSRFFGVPLWAEETKVVTQVNIGATRVYCNTTNRSFGVGSFVLLWRDADLYEAAEILAKTDTYIDITTEFGNTWPVGSRVYPMFSGLIAASFSGTRHTDAVIEVPVVFESDPATTVGNTPAVAAPASYRGYELYLGRLNWITGLEFQFDSDRVPFDLNTGSMRPYSGSGYTPQTKKHTWWFPSLASAREFREWLGRREGIARPCYIPTGNTDLVLIADPLSGGLTIDVLDTEYATLLGAHPIRKDIFMLLRNGTYYTRRIASATPILGGVRLMLDTPWPTNIAKSTVKRISFLGLFRQVSNKATISWAAAGKGVAELMLVNDRDDL